MAFYTNHLLRMMISPSGNLAISNTFQDPVDKLMVQGNVHIGDAMKVIPSEVKLTVKQNLLTARTVTIENNSNTTLWGSLLVKTAGTYWPGGNFEAPTGGVALRSTGKMEVTTDLNVIGSISKGGGTFKIDHPLDPENKYLYHSFVESPDMMNIYNGNITTDAQGYAIVTMPSYFNALNKDFRYQLTVIDNSDDFVQAKIVGEISGNSFKLRTSKPNVKVSWQVTGVRQDKFANAHRVIPEVEKEPENKGKYLHPVEFGKPKEMGIMESKKEGGNTKPISVSEKKDNQEPVLTSVD